MMLSLLDLSLKYRWLSCNLAIAHQGHVFSFFLWLCSCFIVCHVFDVFLFVAFVMSLSYQVRHTHGCPRIQFLECKFPARGYRDLSPTTLKFSCNVVTSCTQPPPRTETPLVLTSSGSHCSGSYAYYWNAFLLWFIFFMMVRKPCHHTQLVGSG